MSMFTDLPQGPIYRFDGSLGGGEPLINDLYRLLPGNREGAMRFLADHSDLDPAEAEDYIEQLVAALAAADDGDYDPLDGLEDPVLYRTHGEIADAAHQAMARVWFGRGSGNKQEVHGELMQSIYPDLDAYTGDEWSWGYLSGVLAALRWVQGDGWGSLDS